MSQRLIILGASGNGNDILDLVEAINSQSSTWEVAGFLDDAREQGTSHLGYSVLGKIADAALMNGFCFVNAIGSDATFRLRAGIVERASVANCRFATLIHPGASVSARAKIGAGVCVNHGAAISGAVMIGNHVWVGPSTTIGHDSTVGDHTVIAPGAIVSGAVRIGCSCYIGAGSSIRQKVVLGFEALVGMGAVVVHDVPAEVTVVGNPAHPIRQPSFV